MVSRSPKYLTCSCTNGSQNEKLCRLLFGLMHLTKYKLLFLSCRSTKSDSSFLKAADTNFVGFLVFTFCVKIWSMNLFWDLIYCRLTSRFLLRNPLIEYVTDLAVCFTSKMPLTFIVTSLTLQVFLSLFRNVSSSALPKAHVSWRTSNRQTGDFSRQSSRIWLSLNVMD